MAGDTRRRAAPANTLADPLSLCSSLRKRGTEIGCHPGPRHRHMGTGVASARHKLQGASALLATGEPNTCATAGAAAAASLRESEGQHCCGKVNSMERVAVEVGRQGYRRLAGGSPRPSRMPCRRLQIFCRNNCDTKFTYAPLHFINSPVIWIPIWIAIRIFTYKIFYIFT